MPYLDALFYFVSVTTEYDIIFLLIFIHYNNNALFRPYIGVITDQRDQLIEKEKSR